MATHDYVIDNSTGANVRADINLVLQAILTNNSSSSAPSTTAAYMLWVDTTANIVKIRNSSDNAWINLFTTAGGIDVDAASNFNEDVTFTGASYNVVWDKSDNALEFADNAKAKFGTGDDLQIFHDGNNSNINEGGTGYLAIRSNNIRFENAAANEALLYITENGSVGLYYDNVKQVETNANGILLEDDHRVTFGDSNDGDLRFRSATNALQLTVNNAQPFHLILGGDDALKAIANGAVELYYDNTKRLETVSYGIKTSGTVEIDGNCYPTSDNNNALGGSGNRWNTVYAANGTINTSDKNEKNTIVESDLGLDFINQLKPISYKWNKDDGKTYYGLIAQDLEKTLTSVGKTIADFGGIFKKPNSPMGLSYTELIAPLIKAVQELSAKVAALEAA